MRSIVKWAIQNSPAMNTLLIASLIVGSISMIIMRREVFPAFALEIVLVSVAFPGSTPEEVEEGICQKIESAVGGIEGVKKMTSVASEGNGFVVLELHGYVDDVQKVLNEVRSEIQQIQSFLPPRAEDPEVKQIVFRAPAISVGVIGPELSENAPRDGPEALQRQLQLRQLAEDVRQELLNLRPVAPDDKLRGLFSTLYQPKGMAITSAEIAGSRPYEIAVEVSEETLREFGISLSQFSNAIAQQNINVPGGKMETASQELLLRGDNKREVGAGIASLPVITRTNGDVVTVGEMAEVIDGFEETTAVNLINGREGLVIEVSKTDEEDLFTVVEAVKSYVANRKVPQGYRLETWGDVSSDVVDRIDLLARNGLQGLILVFIVLAIFLDLRLAFWVAMGIPISILGAGFVLLAFGQTLNMLSMFAFLMALGIVVDDAIVVGENIYLKREEGLPYVQAAVAGTVEVLPSVAASVTTTVIAFMPLFYVVGVMGKFISIMPLAVIAMLVISLLESTFVLPAHLAHDDNLFTKTIGLVFYIFKPLISVLKVLNRIATSSLSFVIHRIYDPVLAFSLNFKPIVYACVILGFASVGGLMKAGFIEMGAFPKLDGREINATLAFPNGTSGGFATDAAEELRQAFMQIDEEIQGTVTDNFPDGHPSVIHNLYEKIGESGDTLRGPTGIKRGSHVATVSVLLTSPSERDFSTRELIRRWREAVPKVSGTEALKFDAQSMGPGGAAIEFKVLGDERSVQYLDQAVEECKEFLAQRVGVFDIEDDSRMGKWEVSIRLTEEGQSSGLSEADVAETIRAAYFGDEVMRLQRGRHEVKLMVRYPREDRVSMEGLKNLRVRDAAQNERPLTEVAELKYKRKVAEINRLNQLRSVTVTADVDKLKANANDIIAELQNDFAPDLIQRYQDQYGANLSFNWEGQAAETAESMSSMMSGFGVALLCMYVLLTLEFRSYVQPLIIMAIIPVAWCGAIVGHGILGLEMTLFSYFGLIALTGVVVNDSIVLVDFINSRIREGIPTFDAIISAGRRRFRPILLTSMTTIAGLFPMLMETSLQAQVLIPMAVSLIFGLLFGTLLILILVPVFYDTYARLIRKMGMSVYQEDEFADDVKNIADDNVPHGSQPATV